MTMQVDKARLDEMATLCSEWPEKPYTPRPKPQRLIWPKLREALKNMDEPKLNAIFDEHLRFDPRRTYEVARMTETANAIEAAIAAHWGERCPEFYEGCPCCGAWADYDALTRSDPAVRDRVTDEMMIKLALQGLVLLKDLFDASDRNQTDAYYILAKQDGAWGNARSALRTSPPEPAFGSFQERVAAAHVALFHDDPTDLAERRNRFYEEATEAVQALGMTEVEAHQLVAYTFSRPVGEPEKEIGAAALTLASLCVVGGWDMQACAEADLAALQTPEKIAKIRAKRSTRHGRGPLPGLSPGKEPQ